MTRGLRAAAAGMSVQLRRQDVHAGNLANASTPGYRRADLVVSQSQFAGTLEGMLSDPIADATIIDVASGPVRETGHDYDLAIEGEGLFAVLGDEGLRYTRDGRFQRAADGRLLSAGGRQVMGRGGPVVLPGTDFAVTEDGRVFSGGQFVDRLFIAEFDREDALRREPDGLFVAALGPRLADRPQLRQGFVEEANVSVMREMAQMMSGFRAFEASATVLRQTDETIGRLIDSALS